jgi:sialate O-acetylesterase
MIPDGKTMMVGIVGRSEGSFDGSVWFRKEITLPKGVDQKTAFPNLGRIKDADITYINGIKVGNVTYEYPPRWYDIPKGVLKEEEYYYHKSHQWQRKRTVYC